MARGWPKTPRWAAPGALSVFLEGTFWKEPGRGGAVPRGPYRRLSSWEPSFLPSC